MAKIWYPVIDYLICTECGTCITKCTHGVYDAAKAPTPVVTEPEACIDHCHGCGNRCPVGAITYTGDDTGWMPLNGHSNFDADRCSCGGSCC
jgi:NAD-dependent dihydropyrimidine dehydrogenase PreA subunit